MVNQPKDWPWSSYLAMIGEVSVSSWLEIDWLLGQFASQRKQAIQAYRRFVREGQGRPHPWDQVQHQLLLGDDAFVAQYKHEKHPEELREVSKAQRRSRALSLKEYQHGARRRKEAMAEIGDHFGVHYMTVSRAVRELEGTWQGR
jgi:hypothetical protein